MEVEYNRQGLSPKEITASRERHGRNVLTPPEKKSMWRLLLEKFEDPIVRILLVALLLSFIVACYQYWGADESGAVFLEPVGILIAVLLSTGIGFLFERSANKKFDVLNQVNDEVTGRVIRRRSGADTEGTVMEIARTELVVGDVILVETGDEIPADARLLESMSLQVNESTLTGEPLVKKSADPAAADPEATYPSNRIYKGTGIVDGHGVAVVEQVGDRTEYGKVYTGSQIENDVETPLNRQLRQLSGLITRLSYAVAALIIVGRVVGFLLAGGAAGGDWLHIGRFLLNTFMLAVTVIVVTVPEGLPMSVTLSLALSMKRMLASHNLVRKMHACETMGACTVICTDKTGTLTQNQMRVYETCLLPFAPLSEANRQLTLGVDEYSRILKEALAVNSTAYLDLSDVNKPRVMGNPTEGALLLWLQAQGEDYALIRKNARIHEQLTFSTERKYMATVADSHLCHGKRMLFVKGAPEILLSLCPQAVVNGQAVPAAGVADHIAAGLLAYQSKAMRTLGFAYMEVDATDEAVSFFAEGRLKAGLPLQFLGFVAISDPVRADVPEAIGECLAAGIDIKIVTGDTTATATEIGRQIGLWKPVYTDRQRITGPEFAALSETELAARVMDLKIISRARPMDKERLVRALQAQGQVVAVTGDGTNDAPALNAAQVGLSMGDGTSVAKEASDITILDNSFTSINRAVMWGRSLYRNVQRFILFQMTINVVACLVVLIGAFLGAESPLTVTQMLWVNLIMDTFAAMALASLPPTADVMHDRPRPIDDPIISRPMAYRILGMGVLFLLFLFGLMQYFKYEDVTSLGQFHWNGYFRHYFRFDRAAANGFSIYEKTLFFTVFVLLQFWNMFNAKAFKSEGTAFKDMRRCLGGFVPVALLVVIGQWLIVEAGGRMFSVTPLSFADWGRIIAATSVVLWAGEAYRGLKALLLRRRAR
ncbi:MAG: calcium-translocating P-type ATPase, PMCA-type [Bacteroidales bacterium]|nr:calcium-translocating P-type ATPase, PMCA-type [Bacteroidales bacterium]